MGEGAHGFSTLSRAQRNATSRAISHNSAPGWGMFAYKRGEGETRMQIIAIKTDRAAAPAPAPGRCLLFQFRSTCCFCSANFILLSSLANRQGGLLLTAFRFMAMHEAAVKWSEKVHFFLG